MKKFLIVLLTVASFAFAACTEQPEVSINKDSLEMDYKGGTFTFDVTSNTTWKIIYNGDDESLCTPDIWEGEAGTTTVTVTVDKNESTSILHHYLTVVAPKSGLPPYVTRKGIEKKCEIAFVSLKQGAPAYVKFNKSNFKSDYIGGEYKFVVNTNFPWEIEVIGEGIHVEPTSGESTVVEVDPSAPAVSSSTSDDDEEEEDTPGTIVVTIDEWEGDYNREFTLNVTARGDDAIVTDKMTIIQERPELTIGNHVYRIKKMGDGRWWMIDNLCFANKGITIGDGICGVWYPCSDLGNEADESTDAIISKGLLYSDATAFNTTITKTTRKNQEGAQGICPEGWYIPKLTEFMALVGKCKNAEIETVTSAPYYDAAKDCGSLEMLKAAGFVSSEAGYIRGTGAGYAKGFSTRGWSSNVGGVNQTYFFCSTSFSETQWYCLALNERNGTADVDFMNNYVSDMPYAGSIRCIKKDKKDKKD